METQTRILDILRNITLDGGVGNVFIAGDSIPPPLLAFAVHFPRLTLLLEGAYQTRLEQNRQVKTLDLKPREAVFIPPNCWDKPDMKQPSTTIHFLFGKRHTGISLVTSDTRIQADKIALPHTLTGPEQKIIDSILELNLTKKNYGAFRQLITALLACYVNQLEECDTSVSSRSSLLFQDICVYIQENFQHDISRSSVAKHYGISPNHLSRVFKTSGYMKFCDYVNYVRINRAKFLLQNYDLSLHEIAKRCGYSDVIYLCRIFKKITKKTPKTYQKQLLYKL